MPGPLDRDLPPDYLAGVAMPVGRPKRMLIVDRTGIEVTVWPEFDTADLLIDSRTPLLFTMGCRNLVRLHDSLSGAIAQLEDRKDH